MWRNRVPEGLPQARIFSLRAWDSAWPRNRFKDTCLLSKLNFFIVSFKVNLGEGAGTTSRDETRSVRMGCIKPSRDGLSHRKQTMGASALDGRPAAGTYGGRSPLRQRNEDHS